MKTIIPVIILMTLFSITANAQSNPPSPSRGDSTAKPESRASNNSKNSDDNKRPPKGFPAIIEISKTPIIQVEAADKNEKRSWSSSPEWWMVGFSGLLAVITAALAFYTGKLYRATVNLGREAKKTAIRQAAEMERSLAVAKESADQAKESVELTRKELILTQRPKLDISTVIIKEPRFANGQLVRGEFSVRNIGGTPATITDGGYWVEWFGHRMLPMQRPYEGKKGNIPTGKKLSPGEPCTIDFESEKKLAASGPEILRGEHFLYVMGWIEYVDDLKIKRRVNFCRRYDNTEGRFFPVHDPDYESTEQ
jgi:murein DD-endopeptidase MepM/ murein hydrolase activator NlpD